MEQIEEEKSVDAGGCGVRRARPPAYVCVLFGDMWLTTLYPRGTCIEIRRNSYLASCIWIDG